MLATLVLLCSMCYSILMASTNTAPPADLPRDMSTLHTILYGDGSMSVTLDSDKARTAQRAGADVMSRRLKDGK